MLFYSYDFLFLFLPATLVGFFVIARCSARLAAAWLCLASLFFYGFWNPRYVLLILASITFNYGAGRWLASHTDEAARKWVLCCAVAVNLAALAWFKYTDFFISTANSLLHFGWPLTHIVLPLGISIFTFTQIAFLADVYQGVTSELNYIHYALFVTYFPHLIAGPIIHHKKIMPQFSVPATYRPRVDNFALGLTTFTIGMVKKVVLAASFAEYSDPVFDSAEHHHALGLVVAWTGALAYTLEIYFDFSGYSDMAIGLSRLFGITLPENFNAPYKAPNIIEFWRRWNMTLSRFLRDYLYIPLGGNRRGVVRRYANLCITMLLGGLWHGASWTFVAWGALHAVYLVINHAWESLKTRWDLSSGSRAIWRIAGTAVTFLAVVLAWVFFRAESFEGALSVLTGMTRWGDFGQIHDFAAAARDLPAIGYWFPPDSLSYRVGIFAAGLGLVWLTPTTRQLLGGLSIGASNKRFLAIGATCFCILMLAAISASRAVSEFIYFEF